jgi:hypothetical protein
VVVQSKMGGKRVGNFGGAPINRELRYRIVSGGRGCPYAPTATCSDWVFCHSIRFSSRESNLLE